MPGYRDSPPRAARKSPPYTCRSRRSSRPTVPRVTAAATAAPRLAQLATRFIAASSNEEHAGGFRLLWRRLRKPDCLAQGHDTVDPPRALPLLPLLVARRVLLEHRARAVPGQDRVLLHPKPQRQH